jgi:predicted nucleic acid-binding protein
MSGSVFFDTNVLVYLYDTDSPQKYKTRPRLFWKSMAAQATLF